MLSAIFRAKILIAVLAADCVLVPAHGLACTGIYVGRTVSADGSALYGRTVDVAPWFSANRFVTEPACTGVSGRLYRSTKNDFSWILPDKTYAFVSTPLLAVAGRGTMHSACANEAGLAVSGTVTGHTRPEIAALDPFVTATGAGEDSLPGLLATCCGTADEALDLLAQVIAERGHAFSEMYMLADRSGAWYVEVYTGHQWAAVRMPEDKVACWGNQFMLRSFDPASPDVRHSPGLLSTVEKAGRLVRGADGLPDLCATYSTALADYSNYRTWFGHKTFAPETAGAYVTSRPLPLFFAPSRKIGLRDVFDLMRTRYEGTGKCPEECGDKTVRVIGTTKQSTCHVLAVDNRLPAPLAVTLWATPAQAEHAPFLPLNASVTRHDPAYGLDLPVGREGYDDRVAAYVFRRLAAFAELDRPTYGRGVKAFWRAREEELLARYPAALAAAASDFGKDSALAARQLTEFSVEAESLALADARRIFDELSWYVISHNRISGDGSGATDRPSAPFVPKGSSRK